MTSDRWEEINRLYNSAVEVEEKERASFLQNACGEDVELRREVESLLAYDQQAQQLLDRPAMQMAAEKLAGEPPSLVGRKLGPYQILGVLGAGGMGEVYKARDTRLNRTVAIKVLPRHLCERAEVRQRFEREARAIAGLNHPNICALHDIGKEEGIDFLVMEYMEGETLSKRLRKGPLPTEKLLRTAVEIATALDQAHRQGVIHRDLKPGNIMLTKQGGKLLDFGLAKQNRPPFTKGDYRGVESGTESESLTEEGMLLGTLEYMAPEQVEGKEADSRTDIFALGVVMYEMATGKKAFEGESKASLAAAILTFEPPPITKIQPMTPPALERVVQRCLAKDPEDRWQTARDLTSELKWIAEAGGTLPATVAGAKPIATKPRRELLYGALAIVFLVAAIVSTVFYLRLAPAPARAIISDILPTEKTQFTFGFRAGGLPVLSPDGTAVAFSAKDANGKTLLWVRSFDSLAAHPLAETEGGAWPFWSADSRRLGFFADGKLKALELSGGPARFVADATMPCFGSWNREGTLLFVPDFSKGLYQMAASGGAPVLVLEVDKSKYQGCFGPRFLPDGKHFLYHAHADNPASSGTYFASLDGKENRLLLKGDEPNATYGSGYLLYVLDKTLMAEAFDPVRGQLEGDAHPVAEQIASDIDGGGFFDVSENGVLIYQADDSLRGKRITWFDRAGKELSAGERGSYDSLRLSPDGAKLAYKAGIPTTDIWVEDLARGVPMRLTNDPGTNYGSPTWSADGSRILFAGDDKGIYQMNSNGAGGKELPLAWKTSEGGWPTSWSPDARFILYVHLPTKSMSIQDVWVLPLVGDRKPRLFVHNAFDGQFSPDGRWVAYTSPESGKPQIYVVPFDATKVLDAEPGAEISLHDRTQISASSGAIARWRGDGKEIFYLLPGGTQMMAAEVDGKGNSFAARKEQALFKLPEGFGWYDVAPDGKRFIMTSQKLNRNTQLTLVQNWTALLGNKP
jgi:Tol biopolymer transport system component/predicted Ser/Thr protein kinase